MLISRLLLVGLLVCNSALHAQVADTARANRIFGRLTARLSADRSLPDSLRHLSVAALVGPENFRYASGVDDSTTNLFMRTVSLTVNQVPDTICGSFLSGSALPTGDLDVLLPYLDSATVQNWSTFLERVVRVRAHPGPPRRVASDSAARVAMFGIFSRLGAADQSRMAAIAQHPPPTMADACWSMRTVMTALAALPSDDMAPVVRAMFLKSQGSK